jgi:hypothetical protein
MQASLAKGEGSVVTGEDSEEEEEPPFEGFAQNDICFSPAAHIDVAERQPPQPVSERPPEDPPIEDLRRNEAKGQVFGRIS